MICERFTCDYTQKKSDDARGKTKWGYMPPMACLYGGITTNRTYRFTFFINEFK